MKNFKNYKTKFCTLEVSSQGTPAPKTGMGEKGIIWQPMLAQKEQNHPLPWQGQQNKQYPNYFVGITTFHKNQTWEYNEKNGFKPGSPFCNSLSSSTKLCQFINALVHTHSTIHIKAYSIGVSPHIKDLLHNKMKQLATALSVTNHPKTYVKFIGTKRIAKSSIPNYWIVKH